MRMYTFEKTIDYWIQKLSENNIPMTGDDDDFFKDVICENTLNEMVLKLSENVKLKKLYIPFLPKLDGNCLFNSLSAYNEIFESPEQIRKFISSIMIIFANCNIIPNNSLTLREIFELTNEIEYVFCKETKKLYNYTYYTMCIDLLNENSWSRLPVQLILLLISIFYNVIINIHHNNGHITVINSDNDNDNKKIIDIGLIDEFHYVPLLNSPNDTIQYYNDKLKLFFVWCIYQSNKLKLYYDCINDNIDNENNNKTQELSSSSSSPSSSSSSSSGEIEREFERIINNIEKIINDVRDIRSLQENIIDKIYTNFLYKYDKKHININIMNDNNIN